MVAGISVGFNTTADPTRGIFNMLTQSLSGLTESVLRKDANRRSAQNPRQQGQGIYNPMGANFRPGPPAKMESTVAPQNASAVANPTAGSPSAVASPVAATPSASMAASLPQPPAGTTTQGGMSYAPSPLADGAQGYRAQVQEEIAKNNRLRQGLEGFKEAASGMFNGQNDKAVAERSRRQALAGEMRALRNRLTGMAETPSYADVTNEYMNRMEQARGGPDNRTSEEMLKDAAARSRSGYNAMGGFSGADAVSMRDGRAAPQAGLSSMGTPASWTKWKEGWNPSDGSDNPAFGGDSYTAAEQLVNAAPQEYVGDGQMVGGGRQSPDRETAISSTADRIAQARQRFGGSADGTKRVPSGYQGLIMAREDLTDDEKQRFIAAYNARRASRGARMTPAATGNPYMEQALAQEQGMRKERINRRNMRDQYFARRQQERMNAAQQQQQMMMVDMLSRSAAMGNQEAARVLSQLQQSQADIYRQNMQNALGMQEIQSREQMNRDQVTSAERLASMEDSRLREGMENQNAMEGRRIGLLEQEAESKQRVNDLLAEKTQLEMDFDRETMPERKAALANQIKEAEVKLGQARVQLERENLKLKEAQNEIENSGIIKPGSISGPLTADGVPPADAKAREAAFVSDDALMKRAQAGDEEANRFYQLPGTGADFSQMTPRQKVEDVLSRLEKSYGYFRLGSNLPSEENLRLLMRREGISDADLFQARNAIASEGPGWGIAPSPIQKQMRLDALEMLLPGS